MGVKKNTILVVDDNPNNLSLVTSLIKPYYEVLLANNGEKALVVANEKKPNLILLDIMMPGVSGFEVCELLKKNTETQSIPVIFLTAKTSGDDFEKAYEVGGVDYVTKPINAKELLARVKTHLTLCDQTLNLKKLNNEVSSLNNSLEVKIKARTAELEEAVKELGKQNDELEQASYVISHNLRGPVANILGLRDIFNRNNLADPFNGEVFDHLSVAANNLDGIIKDLSAVITMRRSVPDYEKVNLASVIERAINNLKSQINASKATIEVEISDRFEFLSVKSYLDNIFFNLLTNAIKYRSSNPLLINIYMMQENGEVHIFIKDNGIGIDPKFLKKIFEPYKNLSMEPGKGLGLYIVKTQVEALKGEVGVITELGKGSTFSISFNTKALG